MIQSRDLFGPPERHEELRECWRRNEDVFDIYTHPRGRPSFHDLFKLCRPNMVNVIANSDIYFDASIRAKPAFGECFALSRWNIDAQGRATHYANSYSQDAWVVEGGPYELDAPFPMGMPGCDNRIAKVLLDAGWVLRNPSKTIKAYHLHNVDWRSYLVGQRGNARGGDKIERVEGPYHFVTPE